MGHVRSHSEEKPHKCKTCEKGFKDKGNLKQHEATHKSDRPHKCEVCGQCFTFKRNMLRHAEIHAQTSKPLPNQNTIYKCDFCDFKFLAKLRLKQHLQRRHIFPKLKNPRNRKKKPTETFDNEEMQQSDDDLDFGKDLEEIESAEVELDFEM